MRTNVRASLFYLSLATGTVLVPAGVFAAPANDVIAVSVDQAKLVKFPERIATIVVGNPLIADLALQPGGIVVVTGKGYGVTNVVAMDRNGAVVMDRTIEVSGPLDKVITVYRGTERESYSCAPICQRRLTLGDGDSFFKGTMDQAGALSAAAVGSSAAAAKAN